MNKRYYFRKVTIEQGTFVLLYSCNVLNNRLTEILAKDIEFPVNGLTDLLGRYESYIKGEEQFPLPILSLDSFNIGGDTVYWTDIEHYMNSVSKVLENSGISESPISLEDVSGVSKSSSIPVPIKKSTYYRMLGVELPNSKSGEEIIYMNHPGIEHFIASHTFDGKIREMLAESIPFETLSPIDMVNVVATEESLIGASDVSGSSCEVRSLDEEVSLEQKIEELQEKVDTLGMEGKYEEAAKYRQQLAILLDSTLTEIDKIKIDYTSYIMSIQQELDELEGSQDYKRLAEIKQRFAIIQLAQEQESLSFSKRVQFFQEKIREAEEVGDEIAQDAWMSVVSYAEYFKGMSL